MRLLLSLLLRPLVWLAADPLVVAVEKTHVREQMECLGALCVCVRAHLLGGDAVAVPTQYPRPHMSKLPHCTPSTRRVLSSDHKLVQVTLCLCLRG